jgi:hypothetical protein
MKLDEGYRRELDGTQGGWRDEGREVEWETGWDRGTVMYLSCSSTAETACLVLVLDVLLLAT